jgi:radical SAM superfamily enzyme YgiQ (UPF0313 family)
MLVQRDNLLIILARCRARGIRTVVGGPIASGLEELHRYADHVLIGKAEQLIAPLVHQGAGGEQAVAFFFRPR